MASRTRQPRGSGQREEKEGEEGGRQGKGEQRGEGRGKGGGKGGGEGGRTCESPVRPVQRWYANATGPRIISVAQTEGSTAFSATSERE